MHIDDTDDMFDPLVELEIVPYRVCHAADAQEEAAFGRVYLLAVDMDRNDPVLAGADTLEDAEEDLDDYAYYNERIRGAR